MRNRLRMWLASHAEVLPCHGWLCPLGLGVAVLLAFLPGVDNSFLELWDDCVYALSPELAPNWANVNHWLGNAAIGMFTPVAMWSLMLDHWLS